MNQGHIDCLKLLIENGASVTPLRHQSSSFLHAAVKSNCFQAVEALIKAGAPVNYFCIEDEDDLALVPQVTPLDLAMDEERKRGRSDEWRNENDRIENLLVASEGFTTNLLNLLERSSWLEENREGMRKMLVLFEKTEEDIQKGFNVLHMSVAAKEASISLLILRIEELEALLEKGEQA